MSPSHRPPSALLLGILLAALLAIAPGSARAQYACEQWTALAPNGNPPKRFAHQIVYDSDRDTMVLFGGETRIPPLDTPAELNDTWEFDLDTQTWTEIHPSGDVPSARSGHAMAYDSDAKVVVVYGGLVDVTVGSTILTNFYLYDPAAHTWTLGGATPDGSGLVQAAMAYDPLRHQTVVFGGRDADADFDGTFTRGNSGFFVAQHPVNHPPARVGHTMVWSPELGGVLLFGGQSFGDSGFGVDFGDVWLWDGTDWTELSGGGERFDQGAAWDDYFGKLILFGGVDDNNATTADVVFRTTDGTFTIQPTTGGPAPRGRMGFAWNETQKLAVMFGGKGGDTIYGDTWTFGPRPPTVVEQPLSRETPPCSDSFYTFAPEGIGALGFQWQRIVGSATHNLFDNARMFGTTTQQLEIDPTRPDDSGFYRVVTSNECGATPSLPFTITVEEGAWIQTTTGPLRENSQMAFDSGRGKVVLFGGFQSPGETLPFETENDTWEYDGSTWTRKQTTSTLPGAIPGRQFAAMAYDPVRGVTVMYGGRYADNTHQHDLTLSDTWEWNGTTWTQKASGPGPRTHHTMVWDPDRQRIEMYGGRSGDSTQANDLWEWDGTTWTPRTPSGGPPFGNETAVATYDVGRKALVVQTWTFGVGVTTEGQTWDLIDNQWTLAATTTPVSLENGSLVLAYDTARGHPIGLALHPSDPREHETWERSDPATFRLMNVAEPPPRTGFPMVYDSIRHRMVIHGGHSAVSGNELNETYELALEADPLCGVTVCGDGAVDPTEQCDPFTPEAVGCCHGCQFRAVGTLCGTGAHCNLVGQCTTEKCGNGEVDEGEACDPTAADHNPCCTATCTFQPAGTTCGIGSCSARGICVSPTCGNGEVDNFLEECDGPQHADPGCCTPQCHADPRAACGDACRGDFCQVEAQLIRIVCEVGAENPSGCTAQSSATKELGDAGGTLTTPDGSVTLIVPANVGPVTDYSIASGYGVNDFELEIPGHLVMVAHFRPTGANFRPTGVTIAMHWQDQNDDGIVDDSGGVDERQMHLFHNGATIATCLTDAGCDRHANTWTFVAQSFSEFTIAGALAAPCAPFVKPTLALGKILAPAGDDTLSFKGTMPAPAAAPDPDLAGLAVQLTDGNGSVVDVTLPAGLFSKASKTGWKVDKKRTKWTWSHPKLGAPAGIVKATVAVNLKKSSATITVKGAAGSFAALPPVTVTIRFPASAACGATDFVSSGETCAVKSKGKALACK